MRSLRLLALVSTVFVLPTLGACGSTNGSNSSPQGGGDGGNEGGSGSSSGGPSDSGPPKESGSSGDAAFVRADHLPFPQVIYQGGPLMTAPAVVSVTFPGDPNASTYDQLGQNLAKSAYWDAVRTGYCETSGTTCVGDGPAGVSVQITTAPNATYTDQQIQTWLQTEITAKVLPAPDATMPVSNTVYVLYFPMSVSIDDGSGAMSCQAFDGYHGAMTMGSQQVPYAIVDECDYGSPSATLAATTETAAHEAAEAATDPGNPAGFYLDTSDPNTWGWNDVVGGEVADLCTDIFGLGGDATSDGTFVVQRIWSNAFAKGGGDPCNPIPAGRTYFNASPSQAVYVLDVGGSVTFEASAFSTSPTGDWALVPQDWTDPSTPYLSFSIQGGTATDAGPVVMVNNGSKPKITMTLLKDPGGAPYAEADGVLLSVTGDPSNPTADNIWPFVVLSPADAEDAGIDSAVSMRPHASLNRWTRHALPRAAH
ncbi:MAG TPA: hypothetical protein VF765_26375 [Polyangiaceae bacterium]